MTGSKFNEFVEIVKRLRAECPWDKVQTNESIRAATLEEAYEVVEAIDNNDYDELKKELGDLLLHVVFHSVIADGNNKFNIDEVIDFIQAKLIRRHPHIFGEVEVSGAEDVKRNWEAIKLSEGRSSVLEGVPAIMPSLQRAYRLQEKASKVGFDWEKKEDVWTVIEMGLLAKRCLTVFSDSICQTTFYTEEMDVELLMVTIRQGCGVGETERSS